LDLWSNISSIQIKALDIHKNILEFLNKYSHDSEVIDRLIVSSFININGFELSCNSLLNQLYINEEDDDYAAMVEFINNFAYHNQAFNFEELIKVFEFVISPAEKLVNGAVYTPKNIRKYIVEQSSVILNFDSRIADISCGCGGFLFDYAEKLHIEFNIPFKNIFSKNIFGVDIAPYSIKRTKILLSLLAISYGEDVKSFEFNLHVADSFDFDWFENCELVRENYGFDIISGNPPYVSAQNIDVTTMSKLKNMEVMKIGKADLYIPFFEIALRWLRPSGILGYITVNSFLKSLNGRGLRKFLKKNKFAIKLIDFGGVQVFKDRLTYTAICLVFKQEGYVSYLKNTDLKLENIKSEDFNRFDYDFLNSNKGWDLNIHTIKENIYKLENSGKPLFELFDIRNGFATLKNKIYLFTPEEQDEEFYYIIKDGIKYPIEKTICRNAIKPNILKSENEIPLLTEKIIFPYTVVGKTVTPIDENNFIQHFPQTYQYLSAYKKILSNRDKGKREYKYWYLFGRTQALNITGQKLLFPYISDKPYFVYTEDENLLFYNGYAVISDNRDELLFIQRILNSKIFWYYIKHTSKPYSNNYFSFAKNYIKHFSIPQFTTTEKNKIIGYKSTAAVDKFLTKKYNLFL
jgi:adenine-specific DNA-methyltransferase